MNHNHAYMILAFIEKPAAYISALKDGDISRNWVKQDGKSADMRVSAFRIHVRRGAPWFHARLAPSFCC